VKRLSALLALGAAWILALQAGSAMAQQPRAAQGSQAGEPRLEALFTPEDDAIGKIVAAVGRARQEIRVQAYLFTSRKLADALIRVQRAGVDVALIVDQEQVEKGGVPMAATLMAANIPVFVDGQHTNAHNKIIVIDPASDAPVVITGSYNFTVAAQTRNAENVLMVRGDGALATAYRDNWENHRKHSLRMQ